MVYINTILAQGSLESYASLRNLSLIPKKGFLALLINWRPLSILNTIYKLIAKALANRSKTFMPLWIRPSQTSFVKDRHILKNIFTAQEAMYWALSSQQNLALILLDFEKAYDRVSWVFLENALILFGFSSLRVSWIRALYVDASIQIIVNGQKNQPFSLGRSVRQGCPLAPYFFLFVADIFGNILDDQKYRVLDLKLPDNSFLISIMFADDTSLYLLGVPKNLDRAFKILELYCSASGSKLNGHKTRCIWASSILKTFSWGDNLGVQWLEEGEATQYVDIPLRFKRSPDKIDLAALAFISKHLNFWTSRQCSLASKFINATQAIEASLWFISGCVDISYKTLKKIIGLIRNYIWSRDAYHKARPKVA